MSSWIADIVFYSPDKPLLFTQLGFWFFFTIVCGLYSFFYKKFFWRHLYLLLVSFFFYYKSGGIYFFLLIFSIGVDFFLGRLLARQYNESKRRLILVASLFSNLSLLAYYKYAGLIVSLLNNLFDLHIEYYDYLAAIFNHITGLQLDVSEIFLPVGISFFTFQTISYTFDMYRRKIQPVKNIIDFSFYVSFFPQLVAGPIVRAAQFIPQLYQEYKVSREEVGHALFLILNGLIKKILISDFISINFVDRVFDAPASFSGFENLWAVYGYSIQIYCDFSGYTDIAIGIALLLGFRLPVNFYSPYKADSITDFWKRWHISLSTWLRDYLYIPLGGNRKGELRTYINLFVTMLLGGLWHGASLRFAAWGILHGLGLIIHKMWMKIYDGSKQPAVAKVFSYILTFHFVAATWIFFRAESYDDARMMFIKICRDCSLSQIPAVLEGYRSISILIVAAFIIHWMPEQWKETYRGWFVGMPQWAKAVIFLIIFFLLYQTRTTEIQPFIYFRF
mgnify:CR=1 FL=1